MTETILNAIGNITADYSGNAAAVNKDARQFVADYNLNMDELAQVMSQLDAVYNNGDLTGPVIVVSQEETDGTPWVLTVYPDGEIFNALK